MASPTKQTKVRRAMKKASMGKKRKNRVNRHGTTPPRLPLDVPNGGEASNK